MGVLNLLSNIREVKKAVVGDLEGTLIEVLGESDGEQIAAVTAFAANTASQAGDALGLGELQRISFTGKQNSWISTLVDDAIISVCVVPASSVAAIEKKLDAVLHQR